MATTISCGVREVARGLLGARKHWFTYPVLSNCSPSGSSWTCPCYWTNTTQGGVQVLMAETFYPPSAQFCPPPHSPAPKGPAFKSCAILVVILAAGLSSQESSQGWGPVAMALTAVLQMHSQHWSALRHFCDTRDLGLGPNLGPCYIYVVW